LSGNIVPYNGLWVKFNKTQGEDFVTSGGYQSTVQMTVVRMVNGVETSLDSSETVTWTGSVTSSISGLSTGTNGVWKRNVADVVGLTWGSTADGTTTWTTDQIAGNAPSGSGSATHTASLTDVVGSRTITVKVTVAGETSSGSSFTFGKGPLSVFSKTGANGSGGGIKWATYYNSVNGGGTPESFQGSSNSFPAATTFCGGSVNRNVTTDSAGSGPNSSGFTPNAGGWSGEYMPPGITNYKERYALSSKLPKAAQLLAVAAYNNSYTAVGERKGAALAAGWSLGSYNYAWTGEVDYDDSNYGYNFVAVVVNLDYGYVYWYNVGYDGPVAVCLP
jgi:hypothetical protein